MCHRFSCRFNPGHFAANAFAQGVPQIGNKPPVQVKPNLRMAFDSGESLHASKSGGRYTWLLELNNMVGT
jgi:hypothetical protein